MIWAAVVLAYLALASKMDESGQNVYRSAMAKAEIAVPITSAILVIAVCMIGGRLLNSKVTLNVNLALDARSWDYGGANLFDRLNLSAFATIMH